MLNHQLCEKQKRKRQRLGGRKKTLICSVSQYSWPMIGYLPDSKSLNLELGRDVQRWLSQTKPYTVAHH